MPEYFQPFDCSQVLGFCEEIFCNRLWLSLDRLSTIQLFGPRRARNSSLLLCKGNEPHKKGVQIQILLMSISQ